jgi:hypothetical protein
MVGPLREQIRQPRPFRSLEAEAYLNVLRTATVFLAEFVELLRPHAITQPQYNVLHILRGAGDAGLPSGEIGERMVNRDASGAVRPTTLRNTRTLPGLA